MADKEDAAFVTGAGGFQTVPHVQISQVSAADYDVLIIPGGRHEALLNNSALHELIRDFKRENKVIAAICGGPVHLAAAGILEGNAYTTAISPDDETAGHLFNWSYRSIEDVVCDNNILTATGSAYVEFAVQLYKLLGFFENEAEEQQSLAFFKNIKVFA
jgi:4-methyl-5(b-hydroxyethyl)-thiazole monophosphate biosynthesis